MFSRFVGSGDQSAVQHTVYGWKRTTDVKVMIWMTSPSYTRTYMYVDCERCRIGGHSVRRRNQQVGKCAGQASSVAFCTAWLAIIGSSKDITVATHAISAWSCLRIDAIHSVEKLRANLYQRLKMSIGTSLTVSCRSGQLREIC